MSTSTTRSRSSSRLASPTLGAFALGAAGVLFVLYPAVRPWHDETTTAGAVESLGSTAWVASHAFAMLGFVLLTLGLLAVRDLVEGAAGERPARTARAAVVTGWVGAGLTLPYYGAEDFGLHAVARAAAAGEGIDVLGTVDAVRYQPLAVTMFGVGLVLLAVGPVLAALAVRRSGVVPSAGAVVLAVGMALFLPQFFAPAPIRIAHGVLVGLGCLWLARDLLRVRTAPVPEPVAA